MDNKKYLLLIGIMAVIVLVNNNLRVEAKNIRRKNVSTVIIQSNLSNRNYMKKVEKAFKNPNIKSVYVYDYSLLKSDNDSFGNDVVKNVNKLGTSLEAAPLTRTINVKNKPD